jgi:hypothetical protein
MFKLGSKSRSSFWLHLTGVCFSSRSLRVTATMATLIVLAIAQFQTGVSSTGPDTQSASSELFLPATGVLIIDDRKTITVNGVNTTSGATILSGNSIETPVEVPAAINLGTLGEVKIAPATALSLSFEQKNSLKVVLVKGCTKLQGLRGTTGEIETPQGIAGKTDPTTGGSLNVCFPQSARWPAEAFPDRQVADGLFGLGEAAALAIVGGQIGTVEGIGLAGRGSNPGPSAP